MGGDKLSGLVFEFEVAWGMGGDISWLHIRKITQVAETVGRNIGRGWTRGRDEDIQEQVHQKQIENNCCAARSPWQSWRERKEFFLTDDD